MSNVLKNLFIFAGGLAIGAFSANYILKEKYELLIQEEAESIKEVYGRVYDKEKKVEKQKEDIDENKDYKNYKKDEFTTPKEIDSEQKSKDQISYNKIVTTQEYSEDEIPFLPETDNPLEDSYHDDEIEEEDADALGEYYTNQRENAKEPYTITEDEFSNTYIHYDKLTLFYYSFDDVLIDEDEDILDDPEAVVGDGLSRIGEVEPDTAYIRNDKYGTDYVIIKLNKSYAESVLGMESEDLRR